MSDLILRCVRCNSVPATVFMNGAFVCQACAHAVVTVAEHDRDDERALAAALREVGPVPRRLLCRLSGVAFQRATAAIDRMLAQGRLEMRKGMLALAGVAGHVMIEREPFIAMA